MHGWRAKRRFLGCAVAPPWAPHQFLDAFAMAGSHSLTRVSIFNPHTDGSWTAMFMRHIHPQACAPSMGHAAKASPILRVWLRALYNDEVATSGGLAWGVRRAGPLSTGAGAGAAALWFRGDRLRSDAGAHSSADRRT